MTACHVPFADREVGELEALRARLDALPVALEVEVESPRGTRIKRRPDGSVEFVSPIPVPYNYGFAPGRMGGDGDPLDVILLGPTRPRGTRGTVAVVGLVGFVDEGARDDKVVAGHAPLPVGWPLRLQAFFAVYSRFKRAQAAARGARGETRFLGLVTRPGASQSIEGVTPISSSR